MFQIFYDIFKRKNRLKRLKESELEFSEFVVAPQCTKTTINRLTFQHYLKHKDDNIKHQNI